MKIRITTNLGFVAGFDEGQNCVTFTQNHNRALTFDSERAANRWLDDYVNAGYGLSWVNNDIKLVKEVRR